MKLNKLLAALLVSGIALGANNALAYVTPTITNSDGVLSPFGGFDYASGAVAWTNGFAPVLDKEFTMTYIGNAVSIFDTSGTAMYSPKLDASANGTSIPPADAYEYTIVASLTEKVASLDFANSSASFYVTGGTFTIYYGSPDANQATGLGYVNGTKILSGYVFASPSADTFNNVTGGKATLFGQVTYTNSAYVAPDMLGTNLFSTLQLGSGITGFVTPSGFDYDGDGTATALNAEVIFQADANQSFTQVPEPASAVLVGLGLLGLGALRRRK